MTISVKVFYKKFWCIFAHLVQVNFETSLQEAVRMLTEHTTKLQRGDIVNADGDFHRSWHNAVDHRASLLMEKMSAELNDECRRVGAWGILGQVRSGCEFFTFSLPTMSVPSQTAG